MADEQFGWFWDALTCDRDRAMVKVAVDCGVRPGELLGLRGEDVGWGDATIHVVRKGARKEQWLPVSRDAVAWLRRCQAATGYVAAFDEPLWVTTRGPRRPLNYGAYRGMFNRVNDRLGTNWTPHDLRHTACVRMLEGGMDLVKVQEIMGHEYLTTTQTYLRPRLDELIEAHREGLARPRVQPCAVNSYAAADLEAIFGVPR
jgi:integrase